jgi:hypothetical protein
MSDQTVTNKQMSVLDLSPLRDTADVVVVLRPRGTAGASCIVSAETAESDVLQRVKKAGWVDVAPAHAAAPAPIKAPAPAPVKAAEPAPAPVKAAEPAPAPVKAAEPAPAPEPEPAPEIEIEVEPAPPPTKRRKF